MKKKVYISIPISGMDYNKQREKADRIKSALSKRGYDVISPFEMYVGKDPSYGEYLGADVTAIIDHAEAVYMCRGWEESHGCKVERFVALEYGKELIYEVRYAGRR